MVKIKIIESTVTTNEDKKINIIKYYTTNYPKLLNIHPSSRFEHDTTDYIRAST